MLTIVLASAVALLSLMNAANAVAVVLPMALVTAMEMLQTVLANAVDQQKTALTGEMIPVPMSLLLQ
jgi:hypothetical protein